MMKILRNVFLVFFVLTFSAFVRDNSFETIQKGYARVNSAFYHKEDVIAERCKELGISPDNFGNIFPVLRLYYMWEIFDCHSPGE